MPPGNIATQSLPYILSHSAAKSKPIIAEPEIHGAQPLDGVTGFLVLMSEGLYKALEAAHGPGQANQVSWVGQTDGMGHNWLAHGQYAGYLDL